MRQTISRNIRNVSRGKIGVPITMSVANFMGQKIGVPAKLRSDFVGQNRGPHRNECSEFYGAK